MNPIDKARELQRFTPDGPEVNVTVLWSGKYLDGYLTILCLDNPDECHKIGWSMKNSQEIVTGGFDILQDKHNTIEEKVEAVMEAVKESYLTDQLKRKAIAQSSGTRIQ